MLFCVPLYTAAQFSNIIHYTVKDGLPSSTVYSATQDSFGYMWIGTEAGLVRFDGSQFKVFTTLDGLPDNEVLGVVFDSITSRLWIISYSRQACYYRKGKFYTAKNDSSLRSIQCQFGEYVNGNIQPGLGMFLYNAFSVYRCAQDTIVKKYVTHSEGMLQIHEWADATTDIIFRVGLFRYGKGEVIAYRGVGLDSINEKGKWIGNRLFLYRKGKVSVYEKLKNGSYLPRGEIRLDDQKEASNVLLVRDKYIIGLPGRSVYSVDTSLIDSARRIWTGSQNDISVDKQGNIWILTNDDGLYIINNNSLVNYNGQQGLLHDNLTTLYLDGKTLYMGNTYGEMFTLDDYHLSKIKTPYGNIEKVRAITRSGDKLFCITNYIISYFDLITQRMKTFPHISGGPKSLLVSRDGNTILVGLLASIVRVDIKADTSVELPYHKRVIDMARHPDGRVVCASLDGMYWFRHDSLIHIDSDDPRLTGRITSFCYTPDSLLWIGTPANGVIVYDGKKVVAHINQTRYLSYHGAICRKVTAGRLNEIWVATNYGINKINYHIQDSFIVDNIVPLTMADGLLSDDVNDILAHDSLIYIATSHGLTILNERKMMSASPVPIYISSLHINDKDSAVHDGIYHLNYRQNNLRIDYIGVSLPSAGYLRYQYRLLGSGSDKWTTTANTSIEFRSLSSGTYTFEAVVLDKFGNRSKSVARVKFKITPAFYMTIWFWALTFIALMVTGFYIIRGRFKRQQRQFEKEQSLNNKIIELEQQALKAQMNPHFIFNCLTAVQHFVNREDLYSANMYLSNFAKLIRKTLDLSGEQYISLDKEISYLQNYIQLEKMRFQEKFQYEINVAEGIDEYNVEIPPMLIQPIIENAIRHGLRNKDTDTGLLKIDFTQEGSKVICTIDDNGIGMKKAQELKTTSHVEYQSKGMSLTMSRIQAINMISDKKITIVIKDKYDSNNESLGTLVILEFEQEINV